MDKSQIKECLAMQGEVMFCYGCNGNDGEAYQECVSITRAVWAGVRE